MLLTLAHIAPLLIAVPWIAPGVSMCQQFERQSDQILYGPKFDSYHAPTAEKSRVRWAKSKWALKPGTLPRPGDIAYWRGTKWNPAGHVAIVGFGNIYLENSTVHRYRLYKGKGARRIADVRPFDLLVRLPPVWVPTLPPGALLIDDARATRTKYAIRGGGVG